MGLFSRNKPKIKITTTKKDGFSGWFKCTDCHELVHVNELEKTLNCCPKCDYHYRISVSQRIELLVDTDSFTELFDAMTACDPLEFFDSVSYKERLQKAQEKSESEEACVVGTCKIASIPTCLGVMDFSFMGGSMGSVVGEKLTSLIEYAHTHTMPLVIVSISGGARMQESIYSLMQMAKTSQALALLEKKSIPYISILTNPTTGGVTASFASLGDIIIAEPKALICFAGPRVIEQILGKPLPEDAQSSETLLKNGLIDRIVARKELKETLGKILNYVTNSR